MLQHMQSNAYGMDTIEFTGEWRVSNVGAYRCGECTVCGQQIREYYEYRETEAVTNNEENITLHKD